MEWELARVLNGEGFDGSGLGSGWGRHGPIKKDTTTVPLFICHYRLGRGTVGQDVCWAVTSVLSEKNRCGRSLGCPKGFGRRSPWSAIVSCVSTLFFLPGDSLTKERELK